MRISKTPLRITLGGGGSDLGPGGFCINAAITVYTYVAVHPIWTDEFSLHYSQIERCQQVAEIQHPIIRRCLEATNAKPGLEITSMSEMPAESGLGSSGAFTVGLLRALEPDWSLHDITGEACRVDTGLQDQHAAAHGGLRLWRFGQTITSQILDVPKFFFGLALYDTGLRRNAQETLRRNPRPTSAELTQQAADMRAGLQDPTKFADCLNAQWASKLAAAPTPQHRYIDFLIKGLRRDGIWGAKLMGAGDGGMILAFAPEIVPSEMRRVPVHLDDQGTRLL